MAITRRKERVPSDLPPARLFLEDVEEVVAVFQDGVRYELWSKDEPLNLWFGVRELKCDSVEDLQEMGGKTIQFSINAEKTAGYEASLTCEPDSKGHIRFFGVTDDGMWLLYGRVREIFDRRTVRWKHILHRIPWWAYLVVIYPSLFLLQLIPEPETPLKGWRWIAALASVVLVLFLLGYVWYSATVRYTVVELRYRRERSSALRTLKSWLPYIVAAVIGAVIGSVFTVLAERIVRAVWP